MKRCLELREFASAADEDLLRFHAFSLSLVREEGACQGRHRDGNDGSFDRSSNACS